MGFLLFTPKNKGYKTMKTKLNKAYQVNLNTIVAKIKKRGITPLSAESVAWPTKGAKNPPATTVSSNDPRLLDMDGATRTPGKAKKGSRLAAVYANILKGVPTWQVGHPSPQYTTGNVPAHTVLTSGTAKVVKRGHSKPRVLEAPYGKGKKASKLFTPPAKDVELGKQVKALRKATKQSKGK
jgi:hypothetical protein